MNWVPDPTALRAAAAVAALILVYIMRGWAVAIHRAGGTAAPDAVERARVRGARLAAMDRRRGKPVRAEAGTLTEEEGLKVISDGKEARRPTATHRFVADDGRARLTLPTVARRRRVGANGAFQPLSRPVRPRATAKVPPPERFAPKPAAPKRAEHHVAHGGPGIHQATNGGANRPGTNGRFEAQRPSSGVDLFCLPVNRQSSEATARTPNDSLIPSSAHVVSNTPPGKDQKGRRFAEAMVVREGLTSFLHIPFLPHSLHATHLLKRLAKEFLPIIERRGYLVFSVSEMCCCSDAMKVAMGEDRNPKRIKVVTTGGSEDMCGGYNRTIPLKGGSMHLIHLRLRDRYNHYNFRDYHAIAHTMAHELAHCEHPNHGPAFQALMEEIKQEHAASLQTVHQDSDAVEQFGFDIYGYSVSRSKF